jgi:hypothetical protein
MSLVSINDVLKITTRVEKIHPYKVVGDRDSYSSYNEGWSDCVSLIEHYLEQIPSAELERTAKVQVRYCVGYCECGQAVNTYSTYCHKCGARLDWGENE